MTDDRRADVEAVAVMLQGAVMMTPLYVSRDGANVRHGVASSA